jgi:hypothetical protein
MMVGVTLVQLRQIVGITVADHAFLEREDTPGGRLFPNRTRPMIRLPGSSDLISLDQLWRQSFHELMACGWRDLPQDGEPVQCCISLEASEAPIEIVTDQTTIQIKLLDVGVDLRRESRPVPPVCVQQYREDAGVLSQVAIYAFAHDDELFTVTLRQAPPAGERHLLPLKTDTRS